MDSEPVVPGLMLDIAIVPLCKEFYSHFSSLLCRRQLFVSVCCTDCLPSPSLVWCNSSDFPGGAPKTLEKYKAKCKKNKKGIGVFMWGKASTLAANLKVETKLERATLSER